MTGTGKHRHEVCLHLLCMLGQFESRWCDLPEPPEGTGLTTSQGQSWLWKFNPL